jgi:hypothetical protein
MGGGKQEVLSLYQMSTTGLNFKGEVVMSLEGTEEFQELKRGMKTVCGEKQGWLHYHIHLRSVKKSSFNHQLSMFEKKECELCGSQSKVEHEMCLFCLGFPPFG